jgi:hypothetical protein
MNAFKEQCVRDSLHRFVQPTALIDVVQKYHRRKPMAIGTGANTAEAWLVLKQCGLDRYMDVVVGADQVQNPKPAPDTFLRCAELLGVDATHCVVFEDSRLGLQAAASAGMAGIDVLAVLEIVMIRWEAHACACRCTRRPVLRRLTSLRAAGVNYVSINIGMDMNPLAQVMAVIAGFRATIAARPGALCAGQYRGRTLSDAPGWPANRHRL